MEMFGGCAKSSAANTCCRSLPQLPACHCVIIIVNRKHNSDFGVASKYAMASQLCGVWHAMASQVSGVIACHGISAVWCHGMPWHLNCVMSWHAMASQVCGVWHAMAYQVCDVWPLWHL